MSKLFMHVRNTLGSIICFWLLVCGRMEKYMSSNSNYNFSCKWCLQYFGPSSGIQPQNPVGERREQLIMFRFHCRTTIIISFFYPCSTWKPKGGLVPPTLACMR